MITKDQIYCSAHLLDNIRIRVLLSPAQFGGRVWVETVLTDGRGVRQRSLDPRQFHDSLTTKSGQQRRTGYVLETPGESA